MLYEYPKDLFAPLRENRRIIFENIPPQHYPSYQFYELLHGYNVMSASRPIKTNPPQHAAYLSGYSIKFDFETKEEANIVVASCNGHVTGGRSLFVARSKLPLKYTVSWDTGRGGSHNKTGRDEGSEVGTNFEHMQQELYRK